MHLVSGVNLHLNPALGSHLTTSIISETFAVVQVSNSSYSGVQSYDGTGKVALYGTKSHSSHVTSLQSFVGLKVWRTKMMNQYQITNT